jgi:hypothetical protein
MIPGDAHRPIVSGMRSISTRILTAVTAVVFLGGCAADEPKSAVCGSYDSVQASVDDLRNANNSENGLSQVRTDLQELGRQLQQLVADARAQFQTEVETIEKAAADLKTAAAAARSNPTAMTIAAVGQAAAWLRETVHRLGLAMGDTC